MTKRKTQQQIQCPDCQSHDLKKTATRAITETLRREYFTCHGCKGTVRTLLENGTITDVEMASPNQSIVGLVLLVIDRLKEREKRELMAELSRIGISM